MGNVRALALHLGPAVGVLGALLTLACLGVILRRGSFRQQLSAGFLASLLLSPHTYPYDFPLLVLPALLADHVAPRYLLLLTLVNFYPRPDLLPMIVLALGYLVALAMRKDSFRPQINAKARK